VAKKGFTLVEILTAVVIIAIMLGVLMPAFNMVRHKAKDVQQKAQIASIEIGLNLYKNESCFGDYPQSRGYNETGAAQYCGAQTLSESMFGQDLLGVDPNTEYKPNELDTGELYADANDRKGPYLDRTHINVFKATDFYGSSVTGIEPAMRLISDVYNVKKVAYGNRSYKIGTPILYFKANVSETATNKVYDIQDNANLVELGSVLKSTNYHHFDETHYTEERAGGTTVDGKFIFYEYITDPMLTNRPVRPDSFLLISAGNDGLYGTADDICNFEPNIE
jgi:prepilin-type N-terminal cleavage/methylation domain-containing protein